MTSPDRQEPEGTTLNVYSFVVKKGKPVGPREAMKGAHLSSPSVAYWHLQKLENAVAAEERNGRVYCQIKNKYQRPHMDWRKVGAKTDVLFPILFRRCAS